MEDGDIVTDEDVHNSLDSLIGDDGGGAYDEDNDDDLMKELEYLDIKDLQGTNFKALEAVDFDDDNDDVADEEELLALCHSTKEGASHAIVAKGESSQDSDDADIGSDEERDILKEIREDIEQKVREEMKEELSGYQERMRAIEEGRLPGRTDDEKNNDAKAEEDNEEMNPQLREAIIKMNKLDKILRKKVKREKEVKRERLLLERRMRQEISSMEHGASNYREIKMNTEKFLALAPPPSHNEGVSLEPEDEDEEMPPLFQTQFDDSELDRRKKGRKSAAEDRSTDPQVSGEPRSGSSISSQGARSRSSGSGINLGLHPHGKKKKKDFIKRNKELAAEADQPVAMTDDEKRRLQTLLEGVDDLPEIEEGDETLSLIETNPFQLSVHPGEGFCPDSSESRSLSAIDQRLRGLMPGEDFKSIFSTGGLGAERGRDFHGTNPSQPLFTRVGLHSTGNDAAALERFGERVLYDTKEERELQARLLAIESQLEQFKTPHDMEDESAADCHLTDQQLDDLLDQCARNMAPTAEDTETPGPTPRSQLSSRQSLLANPPRLTDEQLQQLLSDAHFPLSSRLLALRDDDQKLEEEDGSAEMIRAETWIAIRDANLGEETGAEEGESSQIDGSIPGVTKPPRLQAQASCESRQSFVRQTHGDSRHVGPGQAEDKNLSSNSASQSHDIPGSLEERRIDEFAFTPDLLTPSGVAEGDVQSSLAQSALIEPHLSSSKEVQGKEANNKRESSGGARAKTGSGFGLPRLPQPPQISSSSSNLRVSAESDAAARISSSPFACSSRDSFDLSESFPTDSNNNGTPTPVRFPEISSNSFLIHTPQGMNNDERVQPRAGLPSRPPLNMVRNNLSDMSVTSLSASDREDSGPPLPPGQASNSNSSAGRRKSSQLQGLQPTPPPTAKKQM